MRIRRAKPPKPVAPRDYRGMPGDQLVRAVREDFGAQTMLSFSRGKDSLGCWLAMRDVFGAEHITPYYLYIVPGLLSFERESLDYFEHVFGRKIVTLPHPGMFRLLGNCVRQSPDHVAVLQAAHLQQFDFAAARAAVRHVAGLPDGTLVASGVRAADSIVRRIAFQTHGPLSLSQEQYYPCWDWNADRLEREIRASGIQLPEDYHLFGRTFDGIDVRFLLPLKRHKPDDYQRVLHWYPLADLEIWMLEKRGMI